jgi:alanyl-tRNA synthetase
MEQQRALARASWRGGDKAQIADVYKDLPAVEFVREKTIELPVEVAALIGPDMQAADEIREGEAEAVFVRTPFYAESGGQVGDTGQLLDAETRERVAIVEGAYKPVPRVMVQKIRVFRPIKVGDKLIGRVDRTLRGATMRNHTATHLLHAALRQVIGNHVKQAGSVVEPGRLRFDFTHYTGLSADEIAEIERLVNEQIVTNTEVVTDVMGLDQALQTGAMALFGEKYGDQVRVVQIPGFSKELCGGTHVQRTGDIGLFKVVYEGSVASGVRRIEAVTGTSALESFQQASAVMQKAEQLLHATDGTVVEQLEKTLEHQRVLERQVDLLKTKIAHAQVDKLTGRKINGATVVAERLDGLDRSQLRTITDSLRNKWGSAVVVLASVNEPDISIVAGVSKDLTSKLQASKLAGELARKVGGKGGGRPDMAEGAGKDSAPLAAALESVYEQAAQLL